MMAGALLYGAALALLLLLPMAPALVARRRPPRPDPADADPDEAFDPTALARGFAERLQRALDEGAPQLGRHPLVSLEAAAAQAPWPLRPREAAAACNRRVWHVAGDAQLPAGQKFLVEVAAWGVLRTAPGGVYRALLAGRKLLLAEGATLVRWAHAREVEVARGCRLPGRVSADAGVLVHPRVRFTLLHAPAVRFASVGLAVTGRRARRHRALSFADSAEVAWDAVAGRGVAGAPLDIAGGQAWQGDLVCHGKLRLGSRCRAQGSLKAHGALRLAAGCAVTGSVFASGLVRLDRGCTVHGSVVSQTAIVLGANCVVGTPERPATVTAPRIEAGPGVVVHGTLWALEHGWADDVDAAAAPDAAPAPARRWWSIGRRPGAAA